jgi:hypothetical protein
VEERRVPFLGCELRIRQVAACEGWDELHEHRASLLGLRWNPQSSEVSIHTSLGPFKASVDRLDAELDLTDDVVHMRMRWLGRGRARWLGEFTRPARVH